MWYIQNVTQCWIYIVCFLFSSETPHSNSFYKNEGLFFQIHYAQVNNCWLLSLIVILIIDYVHCIDFVPSTECVYKWCIPPLPLAELLLYSIYYSVYYTDLTYM